MFASVVLEYVDQSVIDAVSFVDASLSCVRGTVSVQFRAVKSEAVKSY